MKTSSVCLFLILLLSIASLYGQPDISLAKIQSLMAELQAQQADVFFPAKFQKFQTQVEEIQNSPDNFEWESHINQIQNLERDLENWLAKIQNVRQFLNGPLIARERAIRIGAEDFAGDYFTGAEIKLRSAAEQYQAGKLSQASNLSMEAEDAYQRAEFQTIRNNLLGEVRILLQESIDLQAEKLAPRSYRHTQNLLAEVENLVERERFDDLQLSQKSRELYGSAKHLLSLTRILSAMHQAPENAESFILALEEELTTLANQLGEILQSEDDPDAILAKTQIAARNLKQEKEQLEERNQRLELEKRELEREFFKNKSLGDQRNYLDGKIKRVKVMLDGAVEKQDRFLTLKFEPFAFNGVERSINSTNPEQLAKLLDALSEFSGCPLLMRYFQPEVKPTALNRTLANERAEAVKKYLKSYLLFYDTTIQAVGIVYDASQSGSDSHPYLEVRVDIEGYFGLEQTASDANKIQTE